MIALNVREQTLLRGLRSGVPICLLAERLRVSEDELRDELVELARRLGRTPRTSIEELVRNPDSGSEEAPP